MLFDFRYFFSAVAFNASGGQTLKFRVKYGATTIALSTISTPPSADVTGCGGFLDGYIVADGATNAQKCGFSALFTANGSEAVADTSVGFSKIMGFGTGTATEDSTASKTLSVTAEYSQSDLVNGLTAEFWVVEKIR